MREIKRVEVNGVIISIQTDDENGEVHIVVKGEATVTKLKGTK